VILVFQWVGFSCFLSMYLRKAPAAGGSMEVALEWSLGLWL
jgi:hypothetical protein